MSDLVLHNGGPYPGDRDDQVNVLDKLWNTHSGMAKSFLWCNVIAYQVVKAAPKVTTIRHWYEQDDLPSGFAFVWHDRGERSTHYADIQLVDGKLPDEQTIILRRIE